jgi:hypothetical protein
MFENEAKLNGFIKNVKECTALEGYFIGTCYDGQKIFNMLNSLKINEAISIFKNNKKIWELTKKFDATDFIDDETSLGYGIDIYQETINKTFREYLVNYKYLLRVMENNGFVLLSETEYKQLNLPDTMGNFEQLYNFMKMEVEKNPYLAKKLGSALELSDEEKQISFLNNYFIFKKIRNVEYNPDELVSKKQNNKEQEAIDASIREFDELDKNLESNVKEGLDLTSKKLAEKYLQESQILEDKVVESKKPSAKIKLSEQTKKLKLEEKLKTQQEKQALKEIEKSKKAEEKEKLKSQKSKKI